MGYGLRPRYAAVDADNLFAGYSWGRTTVGLGHALLNAVDRAPRHRDPTQDAAGAAVYGDWKADPGGLNLAVNGGYDFTPRLQYGVEGVYNWDCCGLTSGYRRFELGTVNEVGRDESQWLYSFTLANFGNVGDVRRSNSIFRDPNLPPASTKVSDRMNFSFWLPWFPTLSPEKRRKDGARKWYKIMRSETWSAVLQLPFVLSAVHLVSPRDHTGQRPAGTHLEYAF